MTATMCILGASGDLTTRLLLPGLGTLLHRDPQREVQVVGCDRTEMSDSDWQDKVSEAFDEAGVAKDSAAAKAAKASKWVTADVTDPKALKQLFDDVGDADPLVLYFALPPAVSQKVVDAMLKSPPPKGTQLAFEKPFGGNLKGAQELNAKLHRLVPETDVHRVDHFLGFSTVLNIVSLRFANRLFEPVWNAADIKSIEVNFEEDLTLEGRAGYYDKAGAMVDMLQSHLLQVMAFTAMEPPANIEEVELRNATTTVLRSTRPFGGDPVKSSHRARYTAGTVGDRKVPDYVKEDGVDPANRTETLAQITVEVLNQRWAGVPITLRSGKSIGNPRKQIVVTFATVRHLPGGLKGDDADDTLVIDLEPGRVELHLTTNTANDSLSVQQSVLAADLRQAALKPYGEVLAGILDGNPALTVRGDAAEECWRIVEAYQKVWAQDEVPLEDYPAGSDGPKGWDVPRRDVTVG